MYQARFQYRIYPNAEQRQMLARQFGCCRYVHNWALALKCDAYLEESEKISYTEISRKLTQFKRNSEHAWLNEVSSVPLQQALRHLDKAYTTFFRGEAKCPPFKRKKGRRIARIIIVETRDRLMRWGFDLVEAALTAQGRRILVVDDREVEDDLERDVLEVLTSLAARLYGRRSALRRARRALEAMQ